jgi:ribonuclease E
MANTTTPAGRIGGRTDASATTTSDGDDLAFSLPNKLRVHALAKLLSVSSKDVMAALAELGIAVRGAQSSIDRETALRALQVLLPDPEPDPTEIDEVTQRSVPEIPLLPALNSPARSPVLDSPARPLVLNSPAPVFLPPAPQPTAADEPNVGDQGDEPGEDEPSADEAETDGTTRRRRRRGRRGRGRGKAGGDAEDGSILQGDSGIQGEQDESDSSDESTEDRATEEPNGSVARRRRRRRRRDGSDGDAVVGEDDPPDTVVHVRESKGHLLVEDEVQSIRGSTRLEAKRQRRRDGREAGRRRVAILSESEFLARREAVERTMVVRERPERTQIGVLEDDILVEHFVTTSGSGSLVGNVYLGRVQNVLPSMEAAFVDIGRGRNAVLYAGEVDWDAAGLEGKARRIEQALSSGDSVLVQVTKDPVGHKGARLTTQISLPGRFLVYVPGGRATGISRKLPDTERKRLKEVLKRIVPEDAGVIIRTASEGVSEEELARDVGRLQAQWEVIQNRSGASANSSGGKVTAPELLYEEPDLLVKVVRDLFTEDFRELVVQGDGAWDTVEGYVKHVAPELMPRVRKYVGVDDVFAEFRIDEQITKALDRKVWLPSGGYLIIDRTEAMTVIDVNTGKFTGAGGNLEETVTRNNLEAAEEIIRQLRLRDIGGIIVIDFIDMVLESNRDLVLRRLTECLGRDRTRHQVAEVTSLGLVQMTRKKVGTGLLEAYSSTCEHCRGRGVVVSAEPGNVRSQVAPALSGASSASSSGALSVARDSDNVNGRRSKPRGRGSQGTLAASEQAIAQGLTAEGVAPLPAPADDPQSTSAPDSAAPDGPVSAEQWASPATDAPGVPAQPPPRAITRRRRAASRPAGPPATELSDGVDSAVPTLDGTAHEMSTPV